MRKSELYEKIDRYLSLEMSPDEHAEFEAKMQQYPGLSAEVSLQREVIESVAESDILKLRNSLERIIKSENNQKEDCAESVVSEYAEYNFGLSAELSSIKEFQKTVESADVNRLAHSLPRLHLYQHQDSERENIHQFYRDQYESNNEEELFSVSDEHLFSEIGESLSEKDIFDLRSNLTQIAAGMADHQYLMSDIDAYLSGELDQEKNTLLEEELEYHLSLRREVNLHREIENAVQEEDIMALRMSLNIIRDEGDHSLCQTEEIDRYLSGDLKEEEELMFESDVLGNAVLRAELELHKEIEAAMIEQDVIRLRTQLNSIGKEVVKEKGRSIRMPWRKIAVVSVAASLMLMVGIRSVMPPTGNSDTELYTSYYSPYEGSGIARSGNAGVDNTLTIALQKFNARDYDSALSLFQQVIAYDSDNPVGHFYSGVSYQETGRFTQAIAAYEVVVKDKDNLFVEQSEWYIGLCYLQTQERKKAYRQLERISKSNSYYNKKAEAIIRKMKYIE